ncbi:MAG TPA: TolC family protein [Firmicutes bacterium]|nr:TolC family protein [Bacillota bacterium]
MNLVLSLLLYMGLNPGPGWARAGTVLAAGAAGEALTLARSIEIALENNPAVIQAKDALELALSKEREAERAFKPGVSLEAGLDASSPELGSGVTNSGARVTISLRDVLLTGKYIGRSSLEVENARLDVENARRTLAEAREVTKYAVLSAYIDVLKAERSLDLAELSLKQARVAFADAQARKEVGNATEADILDARQAVGKAEAILSTAKSKLEMAHSRFNQTLGRELDIPVHLASDLSYKPAQVNLDELISYAFEHKAEIRRARDDLAKGQLALEKTIEASKPVVTIRGGYVDDRWSAGLDLASPDWNLAWRITATHVEGDVGQASSPGAKGLPDSSLDAREVKGWYAGVGLSWAPFDGGVSRERRLQAGINLKQLERAVSIQETSAILAIREAYYAFQAAGDAVASSDLGVNQAQEALRVMRLRYEAGLATDRDLAAGELGLSRAQVDRAFAVYDYVLARAALERAAGRPIDIQGLPER